MVTDSKGTFPLPKYRKPAKQTGNGRRAIKKELDALQKTIDSNTLLIEILQRNMAATEEAHNLHIAALSNFLGHDMKNCIKTWMSSLTSYGQKRLLMAFGKPAGTVGHDSGGNGQFCAACAARAGRDFQGQQPDWRDGGFDSFDAGGKRGFVHEGIAGRHRFAD